MDSAAVVKPDYFCLPFQTTYVTHPVYPRNKLLKFSNDSENVKYENNNQFIYYHSWSTPENNYI